MAIDFSQRLFLRQMLRGQLEEQEHRDRGVEEGRELLASTKVIEEMRDREHKRRLVGTERMAKLAQQLDEKRQPFRSEVMEQQAQIGEREARVGQEQAKRGAAAKVTAAGLKHWQARDIEKLEGQLGISKEEKMQEGRMELEGARGKHGLAEAQVRAAAKGRGKGTKESRILDKYHADLMKEAEAAAREMRPGGEKLFQRAQTIGLLAGAVGAGDMSPAQAYYQIEEMGRGERQYPGEPAPPSLRLPMSVEMRRRVDALRKSMGEGKAGDGPGGPGAEPKKPMEIEPSEEELGRERLGGLIKGMGEGGPFVQAYRQQEIGKEAEAFVERAGQRKREGEAQRAEMFKFPTISPPTRLPQGGVLPGKLTELTEEQKNYHAKRIANEDEDPTAARQSTDFLLVYHGMPPAELGRLLVEYGMDPDEAMTRTMLRK